MKIYTKNGDSGKTCLFGGQKVWKDDLRINAYGTIDELNSLIGLAVTEINDVELNNILKRIQNELFIIGSDLAAPREITNSNYIIRIDQNYSINLEKQIDRFVDELPELKNFILPGGTKAAAILHHARTVCRRAEREIVKLSRNAEIGNEIIVYLNRLSDFLFVLSRIVNHRSGIKDIIWEK